MGTVAGLLKSGVAPLPGIDKDKDDYYRLFLRGVFLIDSSKDLSKAEAATLINWMMWADGESLSTYREKKPFISEMAIKELKNAIHQFLANNGDNRRLDF